MFSRKILFGCIFGGTFPKIHQNANENRPKPKRKGSSSEHDFFNGYVRSTESKNFYRRFINR